MLKTFVLCFVSVASVFAQTSFWSTSAVPAVKSENDRGSVNLGLKFQATVAGKVAGVRFFKGRYNTGTHVGNLWAATGGQPLASVTFTNETASGWQQANFATPVSINADTTYVISYRAPQGGYADDQFFNWNTLLAQPLVAMGTAPGVFAYSGSVAFPNQTWNRSNYWVDVVFVPNSGTTQPPPPPPPPPSTYGLSGTITGTYAASIALSGSATRSAGTDSGGNYSFTGLANGAYTVTPSASGFTFSPGSTSVTINGMDMTGVNFTASTIPPPPPPPPPPPTGQSFGACHAVGPTATGNGSGSDWSNRMNKLPGTLVRGDAYYLADGSYGSYNFSTANSGTTRITVKKAQGYDYGRTSDGCSNDLSAGWSAASLGSGQAVFSSLDAPSAGLSYITVDGNGQSSGPGCGTAATTAAPASDCGIKLVTTIGGDGPLDIGTNSGGANRSNGWTLRYIEGQGSGDAGNGTGSGEENGMWCRGGCDNLLVEHVWWYNSSCNFIKLPWSAGASIQDSYFKQNYSGSVCHGQFYIQEVNTSNVTFTRNVIQDIQGTGMWVMMTGGTTSNLRIYNNAIFRTQGSNRPGFSNGFFACISSGTKCNVSFVGNSIANYTADYSGADGILNENNNGSSYVWQNNLFYNTSNIGFTLTGASFTEDHNSWLNSGSPRNGSGDVTVASGAPNPFVNWAQGDFHLSSQNAYWGSGAVMGSPFDTDMAGKPRPGSDGVWNRGAFQ